MACNRVIAGMSVAVVIPEARCPDLPCPERKWGTRYQVDFGIRAGRTVAVLAPRVDDPHVEAAFRYFVDRGATPVRSIKEAVELVEKLAEKRD